MKKKRHLAVFIIFIVLFTLWTINVYADNPGYTVNRLSGSDRYDTAIQIADKYSNGEMLQNVVLSTGYNFSDALSGGVFASKMNAPILLTGNTVKDSKKTLDYVESKVDKSGTVYIFGGTGVVSDDILTYLKGKGFANFIRLGGKDRYETNSIITTKLNVPTGTPVIMVNAKNFPGALSISTVAAMKGYPIIVSDSDKLSESAAALIKTIQPPRVLLIGGESELSAQVVTDLKGILPNVADSFFVRIGNDDKYETSLTICNIFSLDITNCILTTGEDFPDGLTGSVLGAKLNAPILLVNEDSLTKQSGFIYGNASITDVTILGGIGPISKNIESSFLPPLNGFDCASSRSYKDAFLLKSSSYSFACRYYFDYDPTVAWKQNLTLTEAKNISKAGLKIVAVYEDGGKEATYFNYNQGVSDAKIAMKNAAAVGQPSNTPIYFAVDYNAAVSDLPVIEAYFQGVVDTMQNKWKIGVYGDYNVVSDIYNKLGSDTYVWQCYAWSDGQLVPYYNVYQYKNDINISGIEIDNDKSNVTKGNNVGGFTVPY